MTALKQQDDAEDRPVPLSTAAGDAAPQRGRRLRRTLRTLGFVAVLAIAGYFGAHWLIDRWSHVVIVDSRVAASVITLSSEVSGQIDRIPVVTGDRVSAKDVLVDVEKGRSRFELEEIDANIAQIDAQRSRLQAEKDQVRRVTSSKLDAAAAALTAAEADHGASQAELDGARSEYDRVRTLVRQHVASAQRLDQIRANFLTAQQRERRAAAGIVAAKASQAQAKAEESQLEVLDRQIATLAAQREAEVARRRQKTFDLQKRTIRAAFDGVVDQVFVNDGEFVTPGKRLLMYHDPTKVWVGANVKETEFRRLRLGAKARIHVDAYPDQTFEGKVTRLGNAATSEFALIPSPNPSGNFTKVTQRLPVRISINDAEALLRPGMMVEVTIDVHD